MPWRWCFTPSSAARGVEEAKAGRAWSDTVSSASAQTSGDWWVDWWFVGLNSWFWRRNGKTTSTSNF